MNFLNEDKQPIYMCCDSCQQTIINGLKKITPDNFFSEGIFLVKNISEGCKNKKIQSQEKGSITQSIVNDASSYKKIKLQVRKEIADECKEDINKTIFHLMNGFKNSKLSVGSAKPWIEWSIDDIMKIIRGE